MIKIEKQPILKDSTHKCGYVLDSKKIIKNSKEKYYYIYDTFNKIVGVAEHLTVENKEVYANMYLFGDFGKDRDFPLRVEIDKDKDKIIHFKLEYPQGYMVK